MAITARQESKPHPDENPLATEVHILHRLLVEVHPVLVLDL